MLKTTLDGESVRAFPDQHDVVGTLHHQFGDLRWRLRSVYAAHRPAASCWAVHHACVQLYHALLVGQATVADGAILGIFFVNVYTGNHRVERIGALFEQVHGALGCPKAVGARNDDVLSTRTAGNL